MTPDMPDAAESLLPILEAVRGAVPAGLIDGAAYARLEAVAEMLPGDLTTFWGFECRLGRPEAAADILFQTGRNTRGQRLLAGREPSRIDGLCARWPAWAGLRAFAAQWADPDHPFHDHVRNIWLEFDAAAASSAAEAAGAVAQPCVFFGPEAKGLDRAGFCRLVAGALRALGEPDWGYREPLERFVAALPEGADLFQVGMMRSRSREGLRVCVRHVAPERVSEWLSALGWSGDAGALAGLLREIAPMLYRIALGLDLGREGPGGGIGLECYMVWLEDDTAQWRPFLDFVRSRNLCVPGKIEALLAFPGVSRYPASLSSADDRVWHPSIYRKLHHIKLSVAGGEAVEAKAYLAVTHPGIDMAAVRGGGGPGTGPGNEEGSGDGWCVE